MSMSIATSLGAPKDARRCEGRSAVEPPMLAEGGGRVSAQPRFQLTDARARMPGPGADETRPRSPESPLGEAPLGRVPHGARHLAAKRGAVSAARGNIGGWSGVGARAREDAAPKGDKATAPEAGPTEAAAGEARLAAGRGWRGAAWRFSRAAQADHTSRRLATTEGEATAASRHRSDRAVASGSHLGGGGQSRGSASTASRASSREAV